MKNRVLKFKYEILLLVLVSITLLAMIIPYLLTNTPFEYGGDLKPQHFAFFAEFRGMLGNFVRTGQLPFYSWNSFLGTDFWSAKSYYVLGDVYNYLSILIRTHYYNIFMFQTILKLMVSGFSFYYLSRIYRYNKQTSIILALSYAFSSWILFFLGQPMFISFCSFLPLYFIGIERYLKENKKIVFILSVALLLCTNYYLFFTLSMLTPVYFIYRYYIINGKISGLVKSASMLILYYLLGVLSTGILIFPAAIYIIQNERVGSMNFMFTYDNIKIYFHLIQALFVPSQNLIYYASNPFETGWHATREICLWAGSVTALLLPQVFTDKDLKMKKATILLYLLFILILIMPVGSMLVHGMSGDTSFRFTIIIIVMNLLISGRYLNDIKLINKKTLQISFIVIVGICLLNMPIFLLFTNQISLFGNFVNSYFLSLLSLFTFVIVYFTFTKAKKKFYLVLIMIVTIEMLLNSAYLIGVTRRKPLGTWDSIHRATHVLQGRAGELEAYLNDLDTANYSEYYRVFVPHDSIYWSYSHNNALHYQIRGLMAYDSTYEPSIADLSKIAPQINEFGSPWIFNILDGDLVNFLNTKYAIVVQESELPHQNFELVTDTFRGGLLVYENLDYRALGTSYHKVLTNTDYEKQNDLSLLLNTIICYEEDILEITSYIDTNENDSVDLVNITYGNNYLRGEVATDADSFMVISLPYNEGWKITVNNEVVKTYRVNGGFIGIPIKKGESIIEMNFMPKGFKVGMMMSLVGLFGVIVVGSFDLYKHKKLVKSSEQI